MGDTFTTALAADWKRAMSSLRVALADLEAFGNAAVQHADETAKRAADAIVAAERRIEEASQRGAAALENARRDNENRINELLGSVAKLHAELEAERALRSRTTAPEQTEAATSAPTAPVTEPPAAEPSASTSGSFDAPAYAAELLDHLESVYLADEATGLPPSEILDRLIANLFYASEVFARHAKATPGCNAGAFQQLLSVVLDSKGGTSFGRRLAIAAFDVNKRQQDGRAEVA